MKKLFYLFLLLSSVLCGGELKIDPAKTLIVLPESAGFIQKFAAEELQKHLSLITGTEIPVADKVRDGFYPFYLSAPVERTEPLILEEARWLCTDKGSWIFGDDHAGGKDIFNKNTRTGTLFAVYDFLEEQFQIRWIEPGDGGIVFTPSSVLLLKEGNHRWTPGRLIQREIRPGYDNWNYYRAKVSPKIPEAFRLTQAEYEKDTTATKIWLKRQRMGNSIPLSYGHAFTQWWKLYGKEHPEYFAMQEDGVRRSMDPAHPAWSKLCVSNPGVHRQIIANWQKIQPLPASINLCENDNYGYCRCSECMKLDVPLSGEKFGEHLTDRYIWLANAILRKASEIKPDVTTVMYAYSVYRFPPRKEKVSPQTIIGFVPSMLELDQVDPMYQGWRKAGAEKLFLRPNDPHSNTGLPMGFEKQMFEHFQVGIRNGIIGSDYDMLHGFWPVTGIADYILARAHTDPSRSFEHWENEYCSAYGAANEDVKKYFRYWRENTWEQRIKPNIAAIRELGRYGNFRRGLMWEISRYFTIADFDRADQILKDAASRVLSGPEKKRVESLRLVNRHSRLVYQAIAASSAQKIKCGQELLEFRLKHRDDLNIRWGLLMEIENNYGDITAIHLGQNFKMYDEAIPLSLVWYFQMDPNDVGLKEQWEKYSWHRVVMTWDTITVNRSWENQSMKNLKLQKLLKNYDGVGYYAIAIKVDPQWQGKEIHLYFEGVDESAWVYLNGQKAGERLYEKPEDWKTPFAIRIDPYIDWSKPEQLVTVRVHDSGGDGGIWKPVYLVKK